MPDLVTLTELSASRVYMVRLRRPTPAALAAIGETVGIALPTEPNTTAGWACRAIWTGPDEWMLVNAGCEPAAIESAAVGAIAALVVEVGDGRFALDVEGPTARDFLAQAVSLDLHARAFPVGRSAITLFAQVPVIIDHFADDGFRLWFDVSLRDYVREWCADALASFA